MEDSVPLLMNFLDSCRNEISADELDDMEEEDEAEDGEGIEEQHHMPEDNIDSEPCILLNINLAPPRTSPSQTVTLEDLDFEIEMLEELDLIDAAYNIAIMDV